MAAGGLGMAGGAAVIGVVGGAVGTAVGLGTNRWIEVSKEGLLTESVKLDVTSEFVLLREHGEMSKIEAVSELLECPAG